MRPSRFLLLLPVTLVLAACGEDATAPGGEPRTVGTHPVAWEDAEVADDGVTVTLTWWSGVEPCAMLDRVEVDETPDAVRITVYEGADPAEPDAVCPMVAVERSATVTLDEPLAGRELRDGSGG